MPLTDTIARRCQACYSGPAMLAKTALLASLIALAAPALAASPFAGAWSGTWIDSGNHQSGKAALTVGNDGSSHGTVINSLGLSSPLDGTINDDGQTALTYTYEQFNTRITYGARGRLHVTDGRMSGVLAFSLPNGVVFGHGTFTMDRSDTASTQREPLSHAGATAVAALRGAG